MKQARVDLGRWPDHDTFDVVVLGSGAAGFSAALAASHAGLSVLMVEKEPLFGGTTAS